MGMTNRKALQNLIDNMNAVEDITKGQFDTLLLTSIANSLAIIADVLADKKEVENGNDDW